MFLFITKTCILHLFKTVIKRLISQWKENFHLNFHLLKRNLSLNFIDDDYRHIAPSPMFILFIMQLLSNVHQIRLQPKRKNWNKCWSVKGKGKNEIIWELWKRNRMIKETKHNLLKTRWSYVFFNFLSNLHEALLYH